MDTKVLRILVGRVSGTLFGLILLKGLISKRLLLVWLSACALCIFGGRRSREMDKSDTERVDDELGWIACPFDDLLHRGSGTATSYDKS